MPAGGLGVGSQRVPQAGMGLVPSFFFKSLSCCGEPKPVTVLVVLAQLPVGNGKGAREVACCGGEANLNPSRSCSELVSFHPGC